jgi:hypothetical protein
MKHRSPLLVAMVTSAIVGCATPSVQILVSEHRYAEALCRRKSPADTLVIAKAIGPLNAPRVRVRRTPSSAVPTNDAAARAWLDQHALLSVDLRFETVRGVWTQAYALVPGAVRPTSLKFLALGTNEQPADVSFHKETVTNHEPTTSTDIMLMMLTGGIAGRHPDREVTVETAATADDVRRTAPLASALFDAFEKAPVDRTQLYAVPNGAPLKLLVHVQNGDDAYHCHLTTSQYELPLDLPSGDESPWVDVPLDHPEAAVR